MVQANTLQVRDLACLQAVMGWRRAPRLNAPVLHRFEYLEDLNQRRLRDAEVVLSACCNGQPQTILEIGTAYGEMTALMAQHAPHATVHTVNIPPEEIGQGGRAISFAPQRDQIGRAYKKAHCVNVEQVLANTAHWEPDFGPIDVAFIDGCHDAEFVYSDTRKVLRRCRPGSLVLWHDFAPQLARKFEWVASVCQGVERLYREGLIRGRILHLQDSWVGLYRVPGETMSLSQPLPDQRTSAVTAIRQAA
jgi:predicted O-methyltransferase YrrM